MKTRNFWLPWLVLNILLVAVAYRVNVIDGFSFACGVVLMGINVVGIVYLMERFIQNRVQMSALFVWLGVKFVALILALYGLLRTLPIEPLWLGMGVFTVAISAACVSVPLVSKYHR